jgi:hypothetical protein
MEKNSNLEKFKEIIFSYSDVNKLFNYINTQKTWENIENKSNKRKFKNEEMIFGKIRELFYNKNTNCLIARTEIEFLNTAELMETIENFVIHILQITADKIHPGRLTPTKTNYEFYKSDFISDDCEVLNVENKTFFLVASVMLNGCDDKANIFFTYNVYSSDICKESNKFQLYLTASTLFEKQRSSSKF